MKKSEINNFSIFPHVSFLSFLPFLQLLILLIAILVAIVSILKSQYVAAGTSISGAIAILTYINSEIWKRRQYVEEKLEKFECKLETTHIKKMISAEIRCIELFPFLINPCERFVIIEDGLWAEALLEPKCNELLKKQYGSINKEEPLHKQPAAVKAAIRDNFDSFLNQLQQFEKMIKSGVVFPEMLKNHLDSWLDLICSANSKCSVNCPSSCEKYTPKKSLLEYMGLLENTSKELSVVQKDVRALITRYRTLSSLNYDTNLYKNQNECRNSVARKGDRINPLLSLWNAIAKRFTALANRDF